MNKIAKLLLASASLLTVVGSLPVANDFDINNAYAEDTETISLNDVLKGETWVADGAINITDSSEKYVANFKDIALDSSFKTYIDDTIDKYNESFDENADIYVALKTAIMLKENTDTEEEFLQTIKIGSFSPEISSDDAIVHEVNEYHPDLNLVDASKISEDGSTSRVILYYSDDIVYALTESEVEGTSAININRYLPINSPELDELRVAVESYQTEEQATEFNAKDYTPIDYTELMRDRTGKPGYKDTFYAEVMQYEEGSSSAMALLKKSGDSDKLYYATFKKLPDSRLVEGDTVDVYGTLDGLYSYDTVRGGTNTVPRIIVDKILVEGVDY